MAVSNSSRRLSTLELRVFFIWMTVACFPAYGQSRVPSCANPVALSQEFLKAIYPDLQHKDLVMWLDARDGFDAPWEISSQFEVTVGTLYPEQIVRRKGEAGKVIEEPLPPLVHATMVCNPKTGKIERLWAQGAIVHSEQGRNIRELIEKHPEWKAQEAVEALKAAGALYGPAERDAFVRHIPLPALERFLGPLRIVSVEFNLVEREKVGSFAQLSWSVIVARKTSGHNRLQYYLSFEPFGGALTVLRRVPS